MTLVHLMIYDHDDLRGALKPMLGVAPRESLIISGDLPSLVMPGITPWQARTVLSALAANAG